MRRQESEQSERKCVCVVVCDRGKCVCVVVCDRERRETKRNVERENVVRMKVQGGLRAARIVRLYMYVCIHFSLLYVCMYIFMYVCM